MVAIRTILSNFQGHSGQDRVHYQGLRFHSEWLLLDMADAKEYCSSLSHGPVQSSFWR
jgi:hypothetical protein